jgi:hypothetical protein
MTRIRTINPSPPLGKYPQFRLWGQVGNAPSSIRIKMTTKIVNISVPSLFFRAASGGVTSSDGFSVSAGSISLPAKLGELRKGKNRRNGSHDLTDRGILDRLI